MNIEQLHAYEESQRIKNFHKLIKATKDTTLYDLNRKTLAFAKNTKHPLKIYLTKQQKKHGKFLLALYRIQPELTNARYPGKNLYNDVDFMVEYYKIRYNAKIICDNIYLMTHFNPNILTNAEFVERIAREFPNENILKLICYAKTYAKKYTFDSVEDDLFIKVTYNLPKDIMMQQAKTFGVQFLEFLPKSHPHIKFLVKCASIKDGDKAFQYLPKFETYKENKKTNPTNDPTK